MSALPLPIPGEPDSRRLPDYLPARMVNQFVFCPRLFHYMWVDQLMAVNAEVIEGRGLHKRVDGGSGALPKAEAAMDASDRTLHARSVTLSSESLRVIAKLDIVELEGATATPVDYKRGEPREDADGKSGAILDGYGLPRPPFSGRRPEIAEGPAKGPHAPRRAATGKRGAVLAKCSA